MSPWSRQGLREACTAGLPGLIHFSGLTPLAIPVGAPIRAIRLYLPEEEILSLAGVQIEREGDTALPAHRVSISSTRDSNAEPAGLLDLRPIHTAREKLPWWHLRFDAPVAVRTLMIRNRNDMWASRAYGLCAEWERGDGARLGFDNLAPPTIRARLRSLRARLDAVDEGGARPVIDGLHGLFNRVDAAIETAAGAPHALSAHRASVLARIASVLDRASREELLGLASLAGVLDSLIWRGADPAVAGLQHELPVAAFVLAATLTRSGPVDLRRVTELQRLIPDSEAAAELEAMVDGYAQRMSVDASPLPVRLLPHGLYRSDWAACEHAYVASVREVLAVLADLGYPGAIGYGTLLGAVREGRLIAHDDDVDVLIAVQSRDERELGAELSRIISLLATRGVRARITPGFLFLKVTAPKTGRLVDVFPIISGKDGASVRLYLRNMRFHDMPREVVLPFGTLPFYGQPIEVPHAPEVFLEQHFGESWRVPNRFSRLHWIKADGAPTKGGPDLN